MGSRARLELKNGCLVKAVQGATMVDASLGRQSAGGRKGIA